VNVGSSTILKTYEPLKPVTGMLYFLIIIIQFFIISVPCQMLQSQLQLQHSIDTDNYIMDKHSISSGVNYTKVLEEKHNNAEKPTRKQTN
jgi:hypothetical protein